MTPAIELQNVNVYYNRFHALADVSLSVEAGDFLAIIGPNGGGKTTLLKTMLGLLTPATGRVRVLGEPPAAVCGRIGYVPQFTYFERQFPITVLDAVLMGRLSSRAGLFHHYSRRDRRLAEEMLARLEISHLGDRQISQLSGGQLKRALIARALVGQPDILLLDEPTASLDARSQAEIYALLNDLNAHVTILFVTHDIGVVSAHVKSLACMNQRLFYHGEPELDAPILERVYGCPVEIIAHGEFPHRVLRFHAHEDDGDD